MAILLKNGVIFLHIPKTGGSWVTAVLEDQGLVKRPIGHIHADLHQVLRLQNSKFMIMQLLLDPVKAYVPLSIKRRLNPYRKINRDIWEGRLPDKDITPFIFCFVRHPLSWYESIWKYMYQHDQPMFFGRQYDIRRWHPLSMLNGLGDPNFNKFIESVITKRPGFVTELYGWYTMPGVNFVGKQENLVEDLIRALRMANIDFDEARVRNFKKVNVSLDPVKFSWDSDLRQEILRLEYAALRRYGYRNG